MKRTLTIVAATLAGTLLAVFFVLNAGLVEQEIERRIDSSITVDDAAVPPHDGRHARAAILPGNRAETLLNGDRIFPAMLQASVKRARQSASRITIYWQGTIGKQFVDALTSAPVPREGARAARLVWQRKDRFGVFKDMEEPASRSGVTIVQIGTRSRRLNNRTHASCSSLYCRIGSPLRRNRGRMVGNGRIRTTGGIPLSYEPGRRADAIRVSRQLGRSDGKSIAWSGLLSGAQAPGTALRAGIHELARWRRRKHAAHVSAIDRRGHQEHPVVRCVFRPG